MRALLQRVTEASVKVDGKIVGQIGTGFLVLLGVAADDSNADADLLADKTVHLRVFPDDQGRFNRSLFDIGGAALVVSQFTLYGDMRKGRRPSFTAAAPPEQAAPLVEAYTRALQAHGVDVAKGVFGATMQVALINDGPVTLMLDSAVYKQPRRQSSHQQSGNFPDE
jgi:D-tyrosyl-tRNA(Tyr) deacylase